MDIDEFKRLFGLRVQNARHRRGITQEDLAHQIGRSTDTVSNIERGINSTRLETAFRIAQVLTISLAELFDVETMEAMTRERRQLTERLLSLTNTEDSATLTAIIGQIEILLQVKTSKK